MRRGSELNLSELRRNGINYIHGDTRVFDDLLHQMRSYYRLRCRTVIHAGTKGSPRTVVDINFSGTLNVLSTQKKSAAVIFISTSRVYSIPDLLKIKYSVGKTRFLIDNLLSSPGLSSMYL